MARQLWLLRHAEAEPHGLRADAERRLTARGERQAEVAGAALAALGVGFELVLVSPKVRAVQTAAIAERSCDGAGAWGLRTHGALAGHFTADEALAELAGLSADGRLLLVGHEPDLSFLAGALSGARIRLRKGGIAALRLEGPGGELVLLVRPDELALMAGQPQVEV